MEFHTVKGKTVVVGLYQGEDGLFHGAVAVPTSMVATTDVQMGVIVPLARYSSLGPPETAKSFIMGTEPYTLLAEDLGTELSRGDRAQGWAALDGVELKGAMASLKAQMPVLDQEVGTMLA